MAMRDAQVLGRHVEGLAELQELRRELDREGAVGQRLAAVFAAAVSYFAVEQAIRGLLLTDPELNRAHRTMAAATGLGPQLPVDELAAWLESRRLAGDVADDLDVRSAAVMVCGTADYVATLELTIAAPVATSAHGGGERLVPALLAAIGAHDRAPALAAD